MKRVLVLIAATVLLSSQAFGQQQANELSLDDCIDLALRNRASIIAAHGREQLAAAGKRSSLGAFLPRVSASYTTSKATVTDIASEVESSGVTFRSEQPDQDRDNRSCRAVRRRGRGPDPGCRPWAAGDGRHGPAWRGVQAPDIAVRLAGAGAGGPEAPVQSSG